MRFLQDVRRVLAGLTRRITDEQQTDVAPLKGSYSEQRVKLDVITDTSNKTLERIKAEM